MKWSNSIFISMFFGFILMMICCSIALHYRLESLVVLYNTGLLLGVTVCVYAMTVITYLIFERRQKSPDEIYDLQSDTLFLGPAVLTYGFILCIYCYRVFIINRYSVAIGTLICLCWLAFLHRRTEKLQNESQKPEAKVKD